jgi:hypothetical protein
MCLGEGVLIRVSWWVSVVSAVTRVLGIDCRGSTAVTTN